MLEANKSKLFETIFSIYNQNLLKRRFHSFKVSGLDFFVKKEFKTPLIIYCNHSSWWDGLIAFELSRILAFDSFVMMEERHLRKFFLFRKLGAFSVVREKPREAIRSINYAVKKLKENPDRTLWIFPQGEILPNDSRPIRFYGGLAKIVEMMGECSVASLSMRYEFLSEYKPQIFVKIEPPDEIKINENFDRKHFTETLSEKLTVSLNKLKKDITDQYLADYKSIF